MACGGERENGSRADIQHSDLEVDIQKTGGVQENESATAAFKCF